MKNDNEPTRHITNVFLGSAESWQGCDWTTAFGPLGLDLAGLKARQARLMAEATFGDESQNWAEASRWLEQVERDSRAARSAASSAVDFFAQGEWAAALTRIVEACALESQYRKQLVWQPLHDLIAAAAEDECGGASST